MIARIQRCRMTLIYLRGTLNANLSPTIQPVDLCRTDTMKIDSIELYHVAMPLIYPWRTAYGEDAEIHSVLCRLGFRLGRKFSPRGPLLQS